MSVQRASFELIIATVFWGFGFIGARWALTAVGPLWMSGLRFFIAFAVTFPILLFLSKRREVRLNDGFRLSFWPGFFLALTIIFQTWGLKYTTATNSGFITTLYVLLVPMIEAVFMNKRLDFTHLLLVAVAVTGTALICQWTASIWNFGDFLTLICALAAAAHIVVVGYLSKKTRSSLAFNGYQCWWGGIFSLVLAVMFEPFRLGPIDQKAVNGFFGLVFASTLIGFLIQVRSQRVLSASTAALICLLESPFAALFAYLLLDERLVMSQWIGAILITSSAVLTIYLENKAVPKVA